MSRSLKGLLAVLIICVLAAAGGLFASKPLVEQAVRDVLRAANPDAAVCTADSVDFDPLSRTITVTGIHVSDQRTYDMILKEGTAVPSLRFLLACVPVLRDLALPDTGDAPLFSAISGRDLSNLGLNGPDPVICRVENFRSGPVGMEAAVLKRLLAGEQVPASQIMLSFIVDELHYGPTVLTSRSGLAKISFAGLDVAGLNRRACRSAAFSDMELRADATAASLKHMEFADLFLPDAAWWDRLVELFNRAGEQQIGEQELQGLFEALLMEALEPGPEKAGQKPVCGSLLLRELAYVDNLFHVSEARFRWLSASPRHVVTDMTCDVSTALISELVRLPGRERLNFVLHDENRSQAGSFRETGRLRMEGLAALDYAYTCHSQDPSLIDAAFSDISLDLHDQGLTAMLAFNVDPRPEAVAAMMPMLAAALGNELGDPADAEALQTFLARPGQLTIRSTDPARPIPWFQFLDAALLGRALTITATPGPATLTEQMKAIAR